jgi:hypothetical protein
MRAAFLLGLVLTVLIGLGQLIFCERNGFLLLLGCLVAIIGVAGIVSNLVGVSESIELRWAGWYTVPAGMLAIGFAAAKQEMDNAALSLVDGARLTVIPGTPQDYVNAFWFHMLSLSIPVVFAVGAFAWGCYARSRRLG